VKLLRAVAPLFLALALPGFATTIPADLEARAAALKSHATPATLAWVHDQGATLAKSTGPVDVGAVKVKAQANWAVLGNMQGADIEALCFLVLMEAAKSAQEDLKAVMAHVKAINNAKASQRESLATAPAPKTHTPAPDRISEFVAAARRIEPKTASANLSRVGRR
jgi:uncharacterized protein YciI